MKRSRSQVMLCFGTGCIASGSGAVKKALEEELTGRNLQEEIEIVLTGCNGFCALGPVMVVYPEGIFYVQVKPEDIPHLVEEHFLKGRPVERLMYKEPIEKTPVPLMRDIEFFKHQRIIALRNRGLIDAESIDEYIARDGYLALSKALKSMRPEEVIQEVKKSGLRKVRSKKSTK